MTTFNPGHQKGAKRPADRLPLKGSRKSGLDVSAAQGTGRRNKTKKER